MHGAMLTYGLKRGPKRELLHIDSASNGLKCECVCPHCHHSLIARNGGKQKAHHFAHLNGAECGGARMTALHILAQDIIARYKKVMLPEYNTVYVHHGAQLKTFDNISLEEVCKDEISTRRPDCVARQNGNKDNELWIEINCRHKIDDKRKQDITRRKKYCIEIDFSDILKSDYTEDDVIERIMSDTIHKRWICCPIWDQEDAEEYSRETEMFLRRKYEHEIERKRRVKEEQERIRKEREAALEKQKQDSLDYTHMVVVYLHWRIMQDEESTNDVLAEIKKKPFDKEGYCIYRLLVSDDRWLNFIDFIPRNEIGRKVFYGLLHYYYDKVSFNNQANALDLNMVKGHIRQLLKTPSEISQVDKVYLEYNVVLYCLHMINNSHRNTQVNNLSKIFLDNENIRQLFFNLLIRFGCFSIAEQESLNTIEDELANDENKSPILEIIQICFTRNNY